MRNVWSKVSGILAAAVIIAALGLLPAVLHTSAQQGLRGPFTGDAWFPAPFTLHFGNYATTDAVLQQGAANTLDYGPVGAHLGSGTSNKDVAGICTLGTNCTITFVNTYTAAPACVATDTTGANAVKAVTSGGPPVTTLTITGTGTDVIAYFCWAVTN